MSRQNVRITGIRVDRRPRDHRNWTNARRVPITPLIIQPSGPTELIAKIPTHPKSLESELGRRINGKHTWVSQSGPRCSQVYLPLICHPNSDSNDFGCVGILAKSSVSPDGWIISGVIGTRRALVLLQRSRGFWSIHIPVILTTCRLT